MSFKQLNFNASSLPFKKIGKLYFLSMDWLNYLEFLALIFFGIILIILGFTFDRTLIYFSLIPFYFALIYLKNRFLIPVYTGLEKEQNCKLVETLALKQNNRNYSLEFKGLFAFMYEMKSYNFRRNYDNQYKESVIVYCEDKLIWIGSLKDRNFVLNFFSNKKQWIKLIRLNK